MTPHKTWILALLLASTVAVQAQGLNASPGKSALLAPKPPLGWNSWDAYGLTITETQFRQNVDVLAKELRPFGWDYAVIDEGWFLKNPLDRPTPDKLAYQIDENGRYVPVPDRFPSALENETNIGFSTLGAYVHQKGLKFGIHIVRGIPRVALAQNLPVAGSKFRAQDVADTTDACPWDPTNWGVKDTPAGQAWYDALIAQYAAWGVDYLKVDCIADHPYKPAEVLMLHRAIQKSGRPILLSLSPGPTSPGIAKELIPLAQMWRISDDVWDFWTNTRSWPRSVRDQFELAAGWAPYARPGTWPDADMLPLGYLGPAPGEGVARQSRLSHEEQRTMMSLWAIARSPLIFGGNLTQLDDWTKALLTNAAVLKLNQNGHDQRQASREADLTVWTSKGEPGTNYLALFNLGDQPLSVDNLYTFYNLPSGSLHATDLWTHLALPASNSISVKIPPHGCVLLELKS